MGRLAAARLADVREQLEGLALFIKVHGNVHGAVARADPLRYATNQIGARPGEQHTLFRRGRLVANDFARLQHLHGLGAVAVHRYRLALRFPRQAEGVLHVLQGGAVGQVDGLGDRVRYVLLPHSLHLHVRLGANKHRRPEGLRVDAMIGEDALGIIGAVRKLTQHLADLLFVGQPFAQGLPDRLGRVQQASACLARAFALTAGPEHVGPPCVGEMRLDAR